MEQKKKCLICNFNKCIEKHHIIKKSDGGSNNEDNLIFLCPNHHYIADFGTDEERKQIIKLIIKLSGKQGSFIHKKDLELIDKKVFVLTKDIYGDIDKNFFEEFKKTSNYCCIKSFLLGCGCKEDFSRKINEKAEKLLLINELNESMPKI